MILWLHDFTYHTWFWLCYKFGPNGILLVILKLHRCNCLFFLFCFFFFFFVKPIHWEKYITRLFTKSKELCRSGPNKVFNNIEYFHWYLINVTGVILEELIEESFQNLMSISTVITDLMFIIYNIFKNQITVLKILWRWQVIISLRFVSQQ